MDKAIVELQAQVRKLSKQIAQNKKTMEEPPYFDCISLDPTIYLRWVQTLEYYFEANECSHEESFLSATQKLQGYAYY